MKRIAKLIVGLALMVPLAGCKSELYTGLGERDANEMVAALAASDIGADRQAGKDGTFSVSVEGGNIAQATQILSARGLPRAKFESLGNLFQSGSMVATPFEERARFMYALDQELAHSISRIGGVDSARVHVMLPEQSPLETGKERPRASVFIYYNPDADVRRQIPVIKTLVVNSVNGLAYEDVAVALFPTAAATPLDAPAAAPAGGWSLNGFALGAAILAGAIALLVSTRGRKAPVPRRLAAPQTLR